MHRLADQWSLYNDWARGDNNLDWAGAEQGQGQHNGQSALGTPAGQQTLEPFILIVSSSDEASDSTEEQEEDDDPESSDSSDSLSDSELVSWSIAGSSMGGLSIS